ncbi:urah [Bugula neritina]|uniref:5-hydroxyisourate hydrolase n=1 Tax=Bugula neritina TaxID=10212 RepID=A0A7J7KR57_BUGNE|nr:urah [Bugula neritina]KAF6040664.1 urah [Bugula neritina]
MTDLHPSARRLKVISTNITPSSSANSAPRMSLLTTHVLNASNGLPAQNLKISVSRITSSGENIHLSSGLTNSDGKIPGLLSNDQFVAGTYKMRFETEEYFNQLNTETFYPYVEIVFKIKEPVIHHHVPLLLSPYNYTTYRGS